MNKKSAVAAGQHPGSAYSIIDLPDDHLEREQAARAEMLETLADFDDDLMEKLLEDQQPTTEEILKDLQKTLKADQVVPVFMGVAEQEMGARRFLEALLREAPEPASRAALIFVSHDPGLASHFERQVALEDGRLVPA